MSSNSLYDTRVKKWLLLLYLHNKKRGYPHLLIRFLRPTTALLTDEQSDTHELLLIHP
ncbi:MAG: hypothetical protein ILA07_06375 [Prevotella sp.]|nr:hypothetical protein [Prevotella sp.]